METLSDGRFRALLASQGLTDLGSIARVTAQSWIVFDMTGSQLWVGLVAGVRAIPTVVLVPLGGALADRHSRRIVLIWNRCVFAALAALTAVLLMTGRAEPWHLLALSLLSGMAFATGIPSFWALLPDLVPPNRLTNANGLVIAAQSSAEMAGPAAVGLLLALTGDASVFIAMTAAYTLAMLLIFRVPEPARADGRLNLSLVEDVRVGFAYVRRTQPFPWLVILIMAQNLLGVAIFPLMPVYASDVLGVGPTGYGLLAGAMGAGLLVGAIAVSVTGTYHRRILTMLAMGFVWDICSIAFGFSRMFPLSLALVFFMGLSGAYWVNAALALFQRFSSVEVRGRVMALWVLAAEMFPLGWLYGGAMASWLGNEEALIISALGGTPVILLAIVLSRDLRRA